MDLGRSFGVGVTLARSFLSPFERPDRFPRALKAMAPWGSSIAGLLAGAAARYPDRRAVVDDDGSVTYATLWARTQSIAASLHTDGIGRGSRVGILARNHRGFVEALGAVAAVGADAVLLNTGFAGPQLADVADAERLDLIIHDDEYAEMVADSMVAASIDTSDLDRRAAIGGSVEPTKEVGRVVILTSGTTGRPKGAARESGPSAIEGVAAILDRIPLKLGDVQVIAAPLFHAWALSHLLLGLSRCATAVVARKFDPQRTLHAVADDGAEVLVVVPVMLRRILQADDGDLRLPSLRVIASSGSAISGQLVTDVLDRFGPVLYNLYGSTEVAAATIAGPDDLAAHPTTAGRPCKWVDVAILDADGNRLPEGSSGRIFVGGAMKFDGYTNGDDKERIGGLVSTGDVGSFRDGLLFVEGRDDDMIVSGGENVFPSEVEELLHAHPAISDVVVTGVADEEFGQVLAAFVVLAPDVALTDRAVKDHVKAQLARHKVPRHVLFIDELPRNTTGKVLRRQLTLPS
ncbi:MAG: fatty-acid--CoA ligase [Acidimicrobiaceae bacterium]|nr:fatty-acid--CoA ligase [Acidimicrobiaceae bacterium]